MVGPVAPWFMSLGLLGMALGSVLVICGLVSTLLDHEFNLIGVGSLVAALGSASALVGLVLGGVWTVTH